MQAIDGSFGEGGGRFTVRVNPAGKLGRLDLTRRGEITCRRVRALVANLPEHIAERECRTIAGRSGWEATCFQTQVVSDARGPGNVVMIQIASEQLTEVFTGFGRKGVKAEHVAEAAWEEAERYLAAGVPVGEHLADQLLLPLGIGAHLGSGGGVFRTLRPTQHTTTHIEVLKRFLDVEIQVEKEGGDEVLVRVG